MRGHVAAVVTVIAAIGVYSRADAQSAPPGPDQGPPPGMEQSFIQDPSFGMTAYVVTYPKGWHYQGRLWQGSSCNTVPAQIFRVTSPDGLIMIERMPSFDWTWGNSFQAQAPKQGCLPLAEAMTANQFLKGLSALLQVEYVHDDTIPAEVLDNFNRANAQSNAYWEQKYRMAGMVPPRNMNSLGAADVRFKNGTFTMTGRLDADVHCTGTSGRTWQGQRFTNTCIANVRYTVAPEGQLDSVYAMAKAIGAAQNPAWVTAWSNRLTATTNAQIAATQATTQNAIATSQADFAQRMAVQQRQHEQFLGVLQRGTDISMANARAVSQQQHTIASDWVDYALGQQTVRDPGTGATSKVPAGSSYTWRNSAGDMAYQTSDPNANPNGTFNGTWTRQVQVHGDGTNGNP